MADDPWGDVTAANSSGGGLGSSGVHPKAAGGPLDQAVAGVDGTTLRRAREVRHAGRTASCASYAMHTYRTGASGGQKRLWRHKPRCGCCASASPFPPFPFPPRGAPELRAPCRHAAHPRLACRRSRSVRVLPSQRWRATLGAGCRSKQPQCSRGVWHTRARCGRLRAQRGDAGAVSLYAALAARARGIIRVELSSKALRGLVF